jgi:DNA polymerase II small subunit
MRKILQENSSLKNLVSINKLSNTRQSISIIGIVSDKIITKNKNMLLEVEDLTGKMRVLVSQNNQKLYEKAEDICLDSVLGFGGFGNREILFANEVVFPDSIIPERKKSPVDESVLFLGDLHFGSKLFMEDNFLKFIDYINGNVPNTPEVEKIKYLFLVGDIIAGVGNYPNQEKDLKIKDIEEQFIQLSKLLSKIRKDIKIIISPGNHDGVRLMEPQPPLNERYAWSIHNLKNVLITSNPSFVNIGGALNFSGFDVLTYHGFSYPYYANIIPKLIKEDALNAPEKIMSYLLKNRHLAPSHSSAQYFPSEEDSLIIKKIPDIFISGHIHKSAVSYYNNILIVSVSSWEGKTAYQEKMGNKPDFCKVPMFNLKTRVIKILDFE